MVFIQQLHVKTKRCIYSDIPDFKKIGILRKVQKKLIHCFVYNIADCVLHQNALQLLLIMIGSSYILRYRVTILLCLGHIVFSCESRQGEYTMLFAIFTCLIAY